MQPLQNAHSFLRTALVAAQALAATAFLAGPLHAQDMTVAEIEKAAKKEGALVWYVAMRSEHIKELVDLFKKKYPEIKLDTVHLRSGDMTARVMTEQRGRKFNADVLSAASYATSQLKAENVLEPFKLPESVTKDLAKGSYDDEGYWVSQYALTFPISYNTERLKAEGLKAPTSYEDLTKPEWRGKFAISRDYYDWYQGLVQALGRDNAKDLAQRIAANQPQIRGNSGELLELLAAGEFVATPHVYGYNTQEEKEKGRPVDFTNASPVVTALQTGGIAKSAPHPNAAKLLQIFMTQEDTQRFINDKLGRTSTHTKVKAGGDVWAPEKANYHILDPDQQVKTAQEFRREYNQIFGIGRGGR